MSAALRAQVNSGRCVLLHVGARWSPESKHALDKVKEKQLTNVSIISWDVDDPAWRRDPYWQHVDFQGVPSFRIWGQRSKLLETTSWETAVEKCRTVAADPITEAWALQTEGNYAEAKKYFAEAMLLGAVHNFQARLGLLRCTLEEAINGEYSTEVESLVRDLRSHHESELEATDFSLLVQGELMAFKQTEDCAPAQCAAIEDLFKGLRVENDESARTVLFKRALDQAIEHYHRETKPKVAQEQKNLDNSQRRFEAEDCALDRLVCVIWMHDKELGNDALFRIEHDLLHDTQIYSQPWKMDKWTPFKPRIIRKRMGGPPRILRNGKWDWLSPDWVIVNNKKMDSGFA